MERVLPRTAAHELRSAHPIVDLRVFRHRALVVGCTYGVAMGIGLYGCIFLFPVYTQSLLGWPAWNSGLAVLPSSITTARPTASARLAGSVSRLAIHA